VAFEVLANKTLSSMLYSSATKNLYLPKGFNKQENCAKSPDACSKADNKT
jgi:hypothetical protein